MWSLGEKNALFPIFLIMKCVFAISGENSNYYDMVKVLVLSAKANTSLELYCVYDGKENHFTHWLRCNSVTILKWEISFLNDITERYDGKTDIGICRGMYLCVEVPLIIKQYNITDGYILYVDVDTMFTGSIELDQYKPLYLCCAPDWDINDWSRFGTGVMIMNTVNLLETQSEFLFHIKMHNYNFEYLRVGPCDQGAWNTFYNGKIEKLEQIYDWKPWWGINDNAKIIHFAGPKPQFVDYVLKNQTANVRYTETEYLHKCVIDENRGGYAHYLKTWKNILQ